MRLSHPTFRRFLEDLRRRSRRKGEKVDHAPLEFRGGILVLAFPLEDHRYFDFDGVTGVIAADESQNVAFPSRISATCARVIFHGFLVISSCLHRHQSFIKWRLCAVSSPNEVTSESVSQ